MEVVPLLLITADFGPPSTTHNVFADVAKYVTLHFDRNPFLLSTEFAEWNGQIKQVKVVCFQTDMFWSYSEKMFLPLALIGNFYHPKSHLGPFYKGV